jgi:hypothetical protein
MLFRAKSGVSNYLQAIDATHPRRSGTLLGDWAPWVERDRAFPRRSVPSLETVGRECTSRPIDEERAILSPVTN